MPANIKHVPTSWNDCKENGVEICQIRELKNIHKHKGEFCISSFPQSL